MAVHRYQAELAEAEAQAACIAALLDDLPESELA